MVDRLTLHVGDEPCYVDDCHVPWTLPSRPMAVPNDAPASDGAPRPGGSASTIDADGVLDLFGRITDRAAQVLSATTDWGESGGDRGSISWISTSTTCASARCWLRASACSRRRAACSSPRALLQATPSWWWIRSTDRPTRASACRGVRPRCASWWTGSHRCRW